MTSGFRLTVALVLVALIAIGFYFASLEGADRPEETNITRDPAPAVVEPTRVDPPVETNPSVAAGKTDGTGTATEPVEPAEAPELASDEPATADAETPLTAAGGAVESDPADAVAMDASTEAADASATPGASEVSMEPIPEPEPAAEALPPAYGPSQGVRASGIYLLNAVSPEDSAIDAGAARVMLAGSIDPRPGGPQGTAWVPIADWCSVRGDGTLQGVITGTRTQPDGEGRFLLVRDDEVRGLRLDGRVSDADAFENNEGRPRVAFLLESDAVDEVREASFEMVGGTVAWIVDGEVVSMPPLEVAIQNRGRINGGFDMPHARWIAARLRGELMRRPGTPDPAADDARPMTGGDLAGRSAAELPASAYTSYSIKEGDNFERIAAEWFGDPRKQSLIAIANPTVDPIRLQIGQVIKLPPKDTPLAIERGEPTEAGVVIHVVRSGETLSDIAVEYLGKASRWREIHDANRDVIGDDPARLAVGMELRIP